MRIAALAIAIGSGASMTIAASSAFAMPTDGEAHEEHARPVDPPRSAATNTPEPPGPYRPNAPLAITGGLVLAGAYVVPAAIGVVSFGATVGCNLLYFAGGGLTLGILFLVVPPCRRQDMGAALMAIPIGGPALYAEVHGADSLFNPDGQPVSRENRDLLYASSIAQLAGLLTLAAGVTFGSREKRVGLIPSSTGATVGASVIATGW